MVKLPKISLSFRRDPQRVHQFWWLMLIICLVGLYFLAQLSDPDNLLAYQQLVVLFIIDSLLFLFTVRTSIKLGYLVLIFLTAMEILVGLYYAINAVDVLRLF